MGAYKISNASIEKKFGVCCNNFKELLEKGYTKLKISSKLRSKVRVLLEDGTEIDEDYFPTVPQQSLLIFMLPGERQSGFELIQLQNFFDKLLASRDDVKLHATLLAMISNSQSDKAHLISTVLNGIEGNIDGENREEDPKWFEGVESRAKTKSAAMRNRAQQRIRGYLSDFKKHTDNGDIPKSARKAIAELTEQFVKQLKTDEYYGCYFVRGKQGTGERYCDDKGWFSCEGQFDEAKCHHSHLINPYCSKSHRVLFSTWNLDHVIEKSRSVFPCIVEAAKNIPAGKALNWRYFYNLLFTKGNLKLVHIVCHRKDEHKTNKCDPKKFYV